MVNYYYFFLFLKHEVMVIKKKIWLVSSSARDMILLNYYFFSFPFFQSLRYRKGNSISFFFRARYDVAIWLVNYCFFFFLKVKREVAASPTTWWSGWTGYKIPRSRTRNVRWPRRNPIRRRWWNRGTVIRNRLVTSTREKLTSLATGGRGGRPGRRRIRRITLVPFSFKPIP